MEEKETKIELYDKREKSITTLYVKMISENKFRMIDNDIFNCRLTLGTEFETRVNTDGQHEIIRITKASNFTTRRFLLSGEYRKSDYLMLADELTKKGGFWQVDFGGIATINIPPNFEFDVDEVMKNLDIRLSEIVD